MTVKQREFRVRNSEFGVIIFSMKELGFQGYQTTIQTRKIAFFWPCRTHVKTDFLLESIDNRGVGIILKIL